MSPHTNSHVVDLAAYAKTQVGALVPGLITLAYALSKWSGPAWDLSGDELGLILAALGFTGAAVWAVPNKDPNAKHQDESVQPPRRHRRR